MDVSDSIILSDYPASGDTAETGYGVKSDVFLYRAVPSDRAGMSDAGSIPDPGWICGSRSGTSGGSVGILKDAG